jgi:hypothetical protein
VISFVTTLFNALAAIPSIINAVESFAGAVTLWLIQRQNNQALAAIADAAALSSRAQTDADRYAAAQAWQSALSKPRVTAN